MKLIRRLKHRKGFTLTELIVVVAIIGILMACVAAFSQPVQSMMKSSMNYSDCLKINEIIGNYLERRVAYAESIQVFRGVDYSTADTGLKDAYDKYKGKYKPAGSKYSTTTGMLVLHFNNVTVAGEEYASGFDVFDIPIDATSSMPPIPKSDTVDNMEAYETFRDKYGIFDKDFFSKFQYFITTDQTGFTLNKYTHETTFSFRIESYLSRNDLRLSSSDVTDYYDYIDDPNNNTNPLTKLIDVKTGAEDVSFILQNIKPRRADNGLYETELKGADIVKGTTGAHGTDIVIFYNVRNYSTTAAGEKSE